MPLPKKTAVPQDDASTRQANRSNDGRGKKVATAANAPDQAATETLSNPTPSSPGISWIAEDMSLLEDYRYSHRLDAPPAFSSHFNQFILTNPGIGRQSPTIVNGRVRKSQKKTSKEQLALAVRKDFNNAAVNEISTAVDMLYKVRHQGKAFRLRSQPFKGKS